MILARVHRTSIGVPAEWLNVKFNQKISISVTTPSFCGDRVENWTIFQPNHSGRIFIRSRSDLSALLRDFFLLLLPHCAMYTILYMCAMPVCQKTAFPVLCVRNFTTSSALQ